MWLGLRVKHSYYSLVYWGEKMQMVLQINANNNSSSHAILTMKQNLSLMPVAAAPPQHLQNLQARWETLESESVRDGLIGMEMVAIIPLPRCKWTCLPRSQDDRHILSNVYCNWLPFSGTGMAKKKNPLDLFNLFNLLLWKGSIGPMVSPWHLLSKDLKSQNWERGSASNPRQRLPVQLQSKCSDAFSQYQVASHVYFHFM